MPLKFLFIGRLLKEKGIHEFVQAAKLVKKIYPDTEFTVLGAIDHHNLGALQQTELDSLISSNIIQYPGHVSNIKEWIADSQCICIAIVIVRECHEVHKKQWLLGVQLSPQMYLVVEKRL